MINCRFAFLVALAFGCVLPAVSKASFLEETRRKALAGDVEAQETLSYLYREGRGVEKDKDEARKWSALAARSKTRVARPASPRPAPSSFSDDPVSSSVGLRAQPLLRSSQRSEPTRPSRFSNPPSRSLIPYSNSRGQSYRMPPTRPSSGYARSRPATPTRSYDRYEDLRQVESRIRRTRKKRLGPIRLIWSPIGFAMKHSKRAVSKIARRSAWEMARPY